MQLTLERLHKAYGEKVAVDDVSYRFGTGIYGLLGINGAGKSTLMRMMCAILQPTSGGVLVDGHNVLAMGARYRQMLGYLPQEFGFYPDLTVWDYVLYIASLKGLRAAIAKRRGEELLAKVGLADQHRTKMRQLSGGMRRRVGIAQALLNDPKVLILDEPTAGLDPNERVRFRNLLSDLGGERTVLLSTHIVADVEYLAQELLLMNRGAIVASGRAQDLVAALHGRVWELGVPVHEVEEYRRRVVVSNVRQENGMAVLRVIAEQPPLAGARGVSPTLEDACLFYFKEQG